MILYKESAKLELFLSYKMEPNDQTIQYPKILN